MKTGAARNNAYRGNLIKDLACLGAKSCSQHVTSSNTPFQRFGNCMRLLINFLEHEMAKVPAVCRICRQSTFFYEALDWLVSAIKNSHSVCGDFAAVAIFKKNKTARDWQKCGNIGGNKIFANAKANNQRTASARRDNTIGLVDAHQTQSVSAFKTVGGFLHRLQQRQACRNFIENGMHDYFSICIGSEDMAMCALICTQNRMIFDNAIMYQRDLIAAGVRMRIVDRRRTMGSPARMAYADHAMWIGLRHLVCQQSNFAERAFTPKSIVFNQRDAS